MTTIHFSSDTEDYFTIPFIKNLIAYEISGNEGYVHFDGKYHVNDGHSEPEHKKYLPQILDMYVFSSERRRYEVEVYDRIEIIDTSVTSTIEDEDGVPMHVCFSPTMEQKIFFRILRADTAAP